MVIKTRFGVITGMIIFFGMVAICMYSCVHAPYVLPVAQRTNDPSICFERDILPIFISNCAKSGCHDEQSMASGYELDNYQNVVKKGIVPGNVAASKIWECVDMNIFGVTHMPMGAPDITPAELDLLRRWIVAGAADSGACNSNCDSANFTFSGAILPMIQLNCLGCHSAPGAAGGSLADYASIKNAAVSGRLIGDISHQAGYNAMPLGGLKLSDCQVAQVVKWVSAGAPHN